jgi:hypothetical protein
MGLLRAKNASEKFSRLGTFKGARPKVIFDRSDFHDFLDFYTVKSICLGDFGGKILIKEILLCKKS